MAQWLQRRTRDGKVAASSPQWWNFLLRGQLCILTLNSVSLPCHSAKGAGGRLQLNAYAPHICDSEGSDGVNWCMVVWCTRNVQFHVAPAMQQPNSASVDIKRRAI